MRGVTLIKIAFHEIGVAAGSHVGAYPEPLLVPVVIVDSVAVILMFAFEAATVHAIAEVSGPGTHWEIVDGPSHCPDQRGCSNALRICRSLRNDVDHAVRRIGSPDGAAGTADDLNAIDVVQRHVLHVPIDAGEERRVH